MFSELMGTTDRLIESFNVSGDTFKEHTFSGASAPSVGLHILSLKSIPEVKVLTKYLQVLVI